MEESSLGNRMKIYEETGKLKLMPLLPIMIRLDGKNFHTFTKGLKRPYDIRLSELMRNTTKFLVEETNALIGYTQSDEISLILYTDDMRSQLYMDGRHFKISSILSAKASVYFNQNLKKYLPEKKSSSPVFDCRTWNVPTKQEAVNTLIWREQDAVRNSIQMAGQSLYSHRELHKKDCDEIQEMLFKKGINWNDYPSFFKRGTYIRRKEVNTPFSKEEIDKLPEFHNARNNPNLIVKRHIIEEIDMPILTKIENREGVIFNGEEPKLLKDKNEQEL